MEGPVLRRDLGRDYRLAPAPREQAKGLRDGFDVVVEAHQRPKIAPGQDQKLAHGPP
jgi:hypothetical protein